MKIKEGTIVKLKGKKRTAKVITMLPSCCGVILDKYLGGFRYWNIEDIEVSPRRINGTTNNRKSKG